MKAFLVLVSLVVLVVAIDETKDGAKDEGLSCESKEGCCVDALDCPGCCKPPYDNQCSNLKGIPMNFCEITGTYFIPRINLDASLFAPNGCPSLNIAGNYPEKCQGTVFLNAKMKTSDKPTYVPQNSSQIDIFRFSSCGHMVIHLNIEIQSASTQLVEPFLLNAVILARNEAGLALVACYAINKSPVLLAFIISPTPKPNQWALAELVKTLEPYYAYGGGKLYSFDYTNCYPSLTALNYAYV